MDGAGLRRHQDLDELAEQFVALSIPAQYSSRLDLEGLTVSVVTARTLYEMKRGTVRARDRADAERLRQRYGFEGE